METKNEKSSPRALFASPRALFALLTVKPVRSELTYLLVSLDKQYTAEQPAEPWESYYAQRILDHFR